MDFNALLQYQERWKLRQEFVAKLRCLRSFLKNWSKNVFGSIKIKKVNILKDIFDLNKIEETIRLTLFECNILSDLNEELSYILKKGRGYVEAKIKDLMDQRRRQQYRIFLQTS